MRVTCPLVYYRQSTFIFDRMFIRLAGNEDNHKILVKLDFGSDPTIGMRATLVSGPLDILLGKCCLDDSNCIIYWIFKLADNGDMTKNLRHVRF